MVFPSPCTSADGPSPSVIAASDPCVFFQPQLHEALYEQEVRIPLVYLTQELPEPVNYIPFVSVGGFVTYGSDEDTANQHLPKPTINPHRWRWRGRARERCRLAFLLLVVCQQFARMRGHGGKVHIADSHCDAFSWLSAISAALVLNFRPPGCSVITDTHTPRSPLCSPLRVTFCRSTTGVLSHARERFRNPNLSSST